jgi:hypothetical protein
VAQEIEALGGQTGTGEGLLEAVRDVGAIDGVPVSKQPVAGSSPTVLRPPSALGEREGRIVAFEAVKTSSHE